MSDLQQEKNEVAQEKYGKDFEELSGRERQSVGGTVGGQHRKGQTSESGGDDSAGATPVSDLQQEKNEVAQEKYGKDFEELSGRERQSVGGTVGGQHRKEQMAEEHGGDASAGYSEMGSKGGSVTNEDAEKKA